MDLYSVKKKNNNNNNNVNTKSTLELAAYITPSHVSWQLSIKQLLTNYI